MKISNDLPAPELDPKKSKIEQTQRTGRTEPVAATGSGDGDSINLSSKAQQLLDLTGRMSAVSAARSEKLESIRLAVNEGRYVVSPELIADRMLRQLTDHPAGI